jgi:DNA-binding NtrC family response regulator
MRLGDIFHPHDIPVIMMTGQGDLLLKERLFTAGASAYLEKPFEAATLVETPEGLLVVLTRRMTPVAVFRRPRESGGPGLQPLAWPLWMPASAGMT